MPVIVSFNSSGHQASKFLGEGWTLPILESHLVFTTDRVITWMMPDGTTSFLARDKSTPSKFRGVNGWSAAVLNDSVVCTNANGWKLSYRKGKLYSIQFRNQLPLTITESDDALALQGNGRALVSFKKFPSGAVELMIGDIKYSMGIEPRPVINTINGQNVISGMAPSLTRIDNGTFRPLEISYAPAEGLMPQVTFKTPQKSSFFVWNSSTGNAVRDDQSSYEVTPPASLAQTAAIKRQYTDGTWESYFLDLSKNQQRVRSRDGKESLFDFISLKPGQLTLRKVTSTMNGKSDVEYSAAFDEQGRLMRQTDSGKTVKFGYDTANRMVEVTLPSGMQLTTDFTIPKEVHKKITTPNGAFCSLDSKDGQWFEVYFASEKTGFFSVRVQSGDLDLFLPPQFKTNN